VSSTLTARQVEEYHGRRPGITEDLFARLRDDDGARPYSWLAAAAQGCAPVLDVGCGSAPLADLLGPDYVGLDRSAAELRRAAASRPGTWLVRADATRLPVAGPFAAVLASMSLMLAAPLDAVLGEVARVVRPGGLLAATVPALVGRGDPDGVLHAAVLARLGRARVTYPEALAPDGLGQQFAAGGLRLVADERRRFTLALRGDADVRLLVSSYYSPGVAEADLRRAAEEVRARVGSDGLVGYPLRRLVAVRT